MKQNSVIYLCSRKKAGLTEGQQATEEFCRYSFTICEIFSDRQSRSRKPGRRPAYQQMLQYFRNHDVNILIIPDLGTLSGSPVLATAELQALFDLGITVYWISGDFLGCKRDPALRREATGRFLTFMDESKTVCAPQRRTESAMTTRDAKSPGRPCALDEGQRKALIELRRTGTPISQLCRMFKISRSTVYKILAPYPELKGTWMGSKKE